MQGAKTSSIRAAIMALILGAGATAEADDSISTNISGYGTVGGTFTSDGNYAYRHSLTEFAGASNSFDVGLESRLGIQAVVNFGSGFSITAQELAKERGDDAFSLGTEWLFGQYSPTPNLKFRLGRIELAAFLLSDSLNVGYAAPWFRAPNEIYTAEPFSSLDGGQALWHINVGPIGLDLEGSYGNAKQTISELNLVESSTAKTIVNVAASLEYKNLLLRVAQTNLDVPVAFALSPTFSLNYTIRDKYSTVGLQYDDGRAIVLSEWAKRAENNAPIFNEPVTASKQWYVAGGWHFLKFTPLLVYGDYDSGKSLIGAGSFGTWSASLRYDVVRNVALKAEVSRPQASNPTYWVTSNAASGQRVMVYSLGADFVF
jgi:hypothetical protein